MSSKYNPNLRILKGVEKVDCEKWKSMGYGTIWNDQKKGCIFNIVNKDRILSDHKYKLVSLPDRVKDLTIEKYSERSFVVRGDTRPIKEDLKNLNAKWNNKLKDGPGWIIPKRKKKRIGEIS